MRSSPYTAILALACVLLLARAVPSAAQQGTDHSHGQTMQSPYAGEEVREIPTLSEEDIRQLRNGEGWGLAKAAELNGVPGPAHLLEMAEGGQMHFTQEQLQGIRTLQRAMKARAIPLGLKLIDLERELNLRFAAGGLSDEELRRLLNLIAETTAELRYVHLSTHLQTLPLLSPHQIEVYNRLRGYGGIGPEKPSGHPFSDHSQ